VTGASCVTATPFIIHQGAIVHYSGARRKIIIPSTVREIGDDAFYYVSSLRDLSFEEGLVRIRSLAFGHCRSLRTLTFPASLEVIGESAFVNCDSLRDLGFASGSRLQCIHRDAFAEDDLKTVILPATVGKIDPSAFTQQVWRLVQFDGPPPLFIKGNFLCSSDSRILLKPLSADDPAVIPAGVEVIGPRAFRDCRWMTGIVFGSGTRLREIGEKAFTECRLLGAFSVPSSVETIGDRSFENCVKLTTIAFEDASQLKKIGESAFARSQLTSITIPASTEEIDGSAFVGCPMVKIEIAPGSRNFTVEGNLLLTSDGTEIVRFFGQVLEIKVPAKVVILRKSCFEECDQVETILFENGSKLRRICRSALSNCSSLRSLSIPASVEIIEENALKGCTGLESCLIAENGRLVGMETEAFSECCSLRSFYIAKSIKVIGKNCFSECNSLHRLKFESGESLSKFVGNSALNEVLETFGLGDLSSLLIIELEDGGIPSEFVGWSSLIDSSSHLTLVQDIA
jgi:hypothetical protein